VKHCHPHNLKHIPAAAKRFGIRVSLPPGDSFQSLIGTQWERQHWFETEHERDVAIEDMASEHVYSRRGDRPTLIYERIDREAK